MDPVSAAVSESMNRKTRLPISDDEAQVQYKDTRRHGTPTNRQFSKRHVSKQLVSKRLKRQVYKTSGLQNVKFTKCQVYKTSGLQNVWLQKNIHIYSVLLVGGNPQVLLQPCLQAK